MTNELPTLSVVPPDAGAYAREALRIAGPDLESICDALEVRHRPYDFDVRGSGISALLVPLLEVGFVALIASSMVRDDPVKARFSVAHEAAHALFYDRSKAPAHRVAPYPNPDEERFCDDFAAELLAREGTPVDQLFSWVTEAGELAPKKDSDDD